MWYLTNVHQNIADILFKIKVIIYNTFVINFSNNKLIILLFIILPSVTKCIWKKSGCDRDENIYREIKEYILNAFFGNSITFKGHSIGWGYNICK